DHETHDGKADELVHGSNLLDQIGRDRAKLVFVDGGTDKQGRQKSENICLQKGDKQFKDIKCSGAHHSDCCSNPPLPTRRTWLRVVQGRLGSERQSHHAKNDEVTGNHVRQETHGQDCVLDAQTEHLDQEDHWLEKDRHVPRQIHARYLVQKEAQE